MLRANGGPTAGQSLDDIENARLLHGRQVPRASHREPGGDPGNRVVGAEEDEEDADAETGHPGVRAPEAVREQEDGQPDQPGERELDHVEAGEPRRDVHQGLSGLVRLGMEDLEAREQQRWDEQEHAAERNGHRPRSIGSLRRRRLAAPAPCRPASSCPLQRSRVSRFLPTRPQLEPGDPGQEERHPDRPHRSRVTEREHAAPIAISARAGRGALFQSAVTTASATASQSKPAPK